MKILYDDVPYNELPQRTKAIVFGAAVDDLLKKAKEDHPYAKVTTARSESHGSAEVLVRGDLFGRIFVNKQGFLEGRCVAGEA